VIPSLHDSLECLETAGPFLFGFSWLYWLREIARDVNKTLPEGLRVEWRLTGTVPTRMHWLWSEHVKLFPQSPKRIYAGLSLVLALLVGIAAEVIHVLLT
jgi:hypothetical protein